MISKNVTSSFEELAKATDVAENKNIVISKNTSEAGGFTIAQQIIHEEDSKRFPIFLKGAFHITSIEGLVKLRDALDRAIDDEIL